MKYKCEICGGEESSQEMIEIMHRGCRFARAFGEENVERKDGLMIVDISKGFKKEEEKQDE